MKKFEIPEMNISMFDAESVTMLSATGQAKIALQEAGADAVDQTTWSEMKITL